MSWRNFHDLTPIDKTDKRDKTSGQVEEKRPFVPFIPFVVGGENIKKHESPESFLAGHHVLVHLEPVGDIWLASDEQEAGVLLSEGIPVLLEKDIRWILQAQGHEARLERLKKACGARNPMTQAVLDIFPGSRISATRSYNLECGE